MQLNPEQQAGVDHRGSPLLVLAGAGTGKTRVITHRVAKLLDEGTPTWRILAVTFTNKAAAEMRERITAMCQDVPEIKSLWVGTFHSICARILRRHGAAVGLSPRFIIYDSDDQLKLMKRVLKDWRIGDVNPRTILTHLDQAKNRGLPMARLERLGLHEPIASIVKKAGLAYEKHLRAADAADFGDLLVLATQLLENAGQGAPGAQLANLDPALGLRRRFLHVVVDEYQDTNPVQARLIELLCDRAELCVVGDDDQAIYGWRGADVAQILEFPRTHAGCRIIRLEQNYRSTGHILTAADAIIRRNTGRLGKTLWSDLGDGPKIKLRKLNNERDEAQLVVNMVVDALNEDIPHHEIAVFYRTHAQSRILEEKLTAHGMRYTIYGGFGFFERKEIKDILAYLRLVTNPGSDVDFERVVNVPARKIGDTTVNKLKAHALAHGLTLSEAVAEVAKIDVAPATARRLVAFATLLDDLRTAAASGLGLGELAELAVMRSGYRDALMLEETEEAQERLENLDEFVGALAAFSDENPDQTLADYLEQVALTTNSDDRGTKPQGVRLMTIHSAKGLEFTRVILTGMEEGVFPHSRSLSDPTQMEEERRLAYVAVTRARRDLIITFTEQRTLFGQTQVNPASRFVRDLPAEAVEGGLRPAPRREPAWNSDIVYDTDDALADTGSGMELFVGMVVRHPRFGAGELLGWDGVGENLRLQLHFTSGTKVILARFCELA